MFQFDVSKFLFLTIAILGALGLVFAFGLYSGAKRNAVYDLTDSLRTAVVDAFRSVRDEATTLSKSHPKKFLQPALYPGSGVTVNEAPDQEALVLLSSFFEDTNELRLIRRDGSLVARWPVAFSRFFPDASHIKFQAPPATDWNIDTHGALILPDGSVLFNFEYGGLVKLDRCGKLLWSVAYTTHHSVEIAEEGGFWVPGMRFWPAGEISPFPPFQTPFREDTLLRISDNGEILAQISVPQLFFDNGLEALLTSTGYNFTDDLVWDEEIVHLNKIAELPHDIADDFPLFDAGDLALSMKRLNLLMVLDPQTHKIKWWHIGPWVRQHDPEFRAGGTIVVFNNNSYNIDYDSNNKRSNITEINPVTNESRIIYGDNERQKFLSIIRGKIDLAKDGSLLITEFQGGRAFEIDASGTVIWEYINRYNEKRVAEITEARIYSPSYFTVSDWSCDPSVN